MILLALLVWGIPGFSLELELALGWAGRPVLEAVNPLWVTLTNPAPTLVTGELRLAMEFGSPWRGRSTYAATVPVAVGGFGKVRLLLPWPVQLGSAVLRAVVVAEGKTLGQQELRFTPELEPLRAGIGPPLPAVDLVLSPAELPADPLLLSPFSELQVFLPVSGRAAEVVRAWRTFWGGEVRVDAEELRKHLAGLRPPPPQWAFLLPGLFLYVLVLVVVFPGLAHGRPQLTAAALLSFLILAVFYSLSREASPKSYHVLIRVERPGFTGFSLELCGIMPWLRQEARLEGWWVELLPPAGWEGRDLHWRFNGETWETLVHLEPGLPRVFLRLSPEPAPSGAEGAPPPWLARVLALPWAQVRVRRAQDSGASRETYVIQLP